MNDATSDDPTIHVAGLRVDRTARELWFEDRTVRLPEKPFLVLEALIERPGEVVTRDELRRRLWPDGTVVDFDNNLNSAVASLRAVLRDVAGAPRAIETLPRIGYRLIAPVTSTPAADTAPGGHLDQASGPRPAAAVRWAAVAAVSVILVLGAWTVAPRLQRPSAATPAIGAAAASSTPGHLATRNPAAGRAWQRGLYLQARRRPDDLRQALAAFETATRLDPQFADAHAQRAETLVHLSFGGVDDARTRLTAARAAAARALELQPDNPAAHRVQAAIALHLDWDLDAAKRSIARATAADPSDPHTQMVAATWFVAAGRFEDAVDAARRAVALDPRSHFVRADLGWFLLAAGRHDEALVACADALAVEPQFIPALRFRIDALVAKGRTARAVEAARELMLTMNVDPEAIDETLAGPPDAALDAFRHWQLRRVESSDSAHLTLALRHAAVGHDAIAVEQLHRAFAAREPFLIYLPGYRQLDRLLAEPSVRQLATRIVGGDPAAAS